MKNYHLDAELMKNLIELTNKGAYILPLMNGVEHYKVLSEKLGDEKVLGGTCKISVTMDDDGYIHCIGELKEIYFGALFPTQRNFCERFEELMKDCSIKVIRSENIMRTIWEKFSFIVAYSGVTSTSRLNIGQLINCESTKKVFSDVLNEMMCLSRSYGVNLEKDFIEKTIRWCGRLPSEVTSSMHFDLTNGRKLEIESIQGSAINLARRKEIELPTIKTLYALLKPFENGVPQHVYALD